MAWTLVKAIWEVANKFLVSNNKFPITFFNTIHILALISFKLVYIKPTFIVFTFVDLSNKHTFSQLIAIFVPIKLEFNLLSLEVFNIFAITKRKFFILPVVADKSLFG